MSMEDLREHGVLLPESEWGAHRLQTTVAQGPLATAFALAVAATVAIYVGAGRLWTWVGLVVFLAALLWIVWICDRAILRQRERTRRERRREADQAGGSGARPDATGGDAAPEGTPEGGPEKAQGEDPGADAG